MYDIKDGIIKTLENKKKGNENVGETSNDHDFSSLGRNELKKQRNLIHGKDMKKITKRVENHWK